MATQHSCQGGAELTGSRKQVERKLKIKNIILNSAIITVLRYRERNLAGGPQNHWTRHLVWNLIVYVQRICLIHSFRISVRMSVCLPGRISTCSSHCLMWCRESWHDDPNAAATTIITDCVKAANKTQLVNIANQLPSYKIAITSFDR